MTNLEITQGDEKTYNLTFTSPAYIDYDGMTVNMAVKRTKKGEPIIEKSVVIDFDSEASVEVLEATASITLTEEDTDIDLGLYWYDIQLSGGAIGKKTVLKGQLEITWQVTED